MLANDVTARDSAAFEKILRGCEHARSAVHALQGVPLLEPRLQIADFAGIRHSLDSIHRGAVALCCQHQAAADNLAVYSHGAGAAHAMLAAHMTTPESKVVTQEIDQCLARIHALADALAVDSQGNIEGVAVHDPASSNCLATRRSSTPARCFVSRAVA